jgi:hypothetical protein
MPAGINFTAISILQISEYVPTLAFYRKLFLSRKHEILKTRNLACLFFVFSPAPLNLFISLTGFLS